MKEIGFSASSGERRQTPRFDVSRWNYGVIIEPTEGHRLLRDQELFVACANFNEAAQTRKVEIGWIVNCPVIVDEAKRFVDSLIRSGYCVKAN